MEGIRVRGGQGGFDLPKPSTNLQVPLGGDGGLLPEHQQSVV